MRGKIVKEKKKRRKLNNERCEQGQEEMEDVLERQGEEDASFVGSTLKSGEGLGFLGKESVRDFLGKERETGRLTC